MKRRDFLKTSLSALAIIPFFKLPSFGDTPEIKKTLNIFDSEKLDGLVYEALNSNQIKQGNYLLNRTYIAKVLSDEEITTGAAIPNIKIGMRIPDSVLKLNKKASLSESEKEFVSDWVKTCAENMALGIQHRANSLIALVLSNNSDADIGVKLNLNYSFPKSLHRQLSNPEYFIKTVNKLCRHGAARYGQQYDRLTMSTKMFQEITNTKAFRLLEKGQRNRYAKGSVGDATYSRQLLANKLKMQIELMDDTYRQRTGEGATESIRHLPVNSIILSRSDYDNNPQFMDFAYGVVTQNSPEQKLLDKPQFSAGYFTKSNTLEDVRAWAVVRALPRVHDKTGFATITYKG